MHNRSESKCGKVLRSGAGAIYPQKGWVLPVYFLTSSFDRAMRKLEETLQFLQQKEERLWFWGVENSDDPNFSGELVEEAGPHLDRRSGFRAHSSKVHPLAGKARSGRPARGPHPPGPGRFHRSLAAPALAGD